MSASHPTRGPALSDSRALRSAGRVALILAILAITAVAFLLRFNALGGSLGGFDDDEFVTLTHVDMVVSGQQPLRDFADNELRGVWPSLSFELPALAQRTWGRNLFVHACYTLGALALCAVMVFVLAGNLSRNWLVALLTAGVVILSWTVPYNYQKLFSMTLGIVAIRWAVLRPTWRRLAALAAATLIAGLFRHDYGLFVGVGAVAGIVGSQSRPMVVPLRRLAMYGGLLVLVSLPSLLWLAWNGGVIQYAGLVLRASLTQSVNNPAMGFRPRFDPAAPLAADSLIALTYYTYWALVVAALALLATLSTRRSRGGHDAHIGTGWALVAMTPFVNYFLLRSHLQARFGDAVVPMALIGPWIVGTAPMLTSHVGRAVARAGPPVLLALMCAAFVPIEYVPHELSTGGFTQSPEVVAHRFAEVRRELLALPPSDWTKVDLSGTLGAARYLAECTAPDDYVLVGTFAEQVPYFARRRFAGGQSYFAFSFLRTEADQRLVLERLGHQSVPVILAAFDYDKEIIENYPLLAQHIASHYHEVGVIDAYGEPWVRVFVENERVPTGTDPLLGFPCFR